MDESLQRCVDLLKENVDSVRDNAELTLLKLCQNILSCPEERKNREVRLDDPIVVEKLLPAMGAMECLFDIGFVEVADHLFLPHSASLSRLRALQKFLSKDRPNKSHSNESYHKYDVLPGKVLSKEEKFLLEIVQTSGTVLRYEDVALQEKARKLIPIVQFEIAVETRIRELQKHIKLNGAKAERDTNVQRIESDINARDLLLAELLSWFKHEFFTWVDSPKCSICSGDCTYEKVVPSVDPKCSRIELHRCDKCKALIKFPRYSDPEPLLSTRCGRCGEWANVFTLFSRSLGYDARLTYDQTDHVWTEIWSDSEKRWIHVDPCENVIDKPLMYEKGWGKKLSYIIAYSKDEVQDVTWRYTRDYLAVLNRRMMCSESNLLELIERLNAKRQSSTNYSSARRQYVTKRKLLELVELIRMPNENSVDDGKSYHGRSTGSYAWKLARGEISQEAIQSYSWNISQYGRNFRLRYSVVKDTYKLVDKDDAILTEMTKWQEGVHAVEGGIFRKVEDDWKMVYLARSPGTSYGQIKWIFEVSDFNFYVRTFDLRALVTVFHGANISWELEVFFDHQDDEHRESIVLSIPDCKNYRTNDVGGGRKLILTATLSGGQGDIAWQHAQLFRQSLDSKESSMIINISLNER